MPLKRIPIGEEITISYLSNPMMSPDDRHDVLYNAFNFHCNCIRCIKENLNSSNTLSLSPSSLVLALVSLSKKEDDIHQLLLSLLSLEKEYDSSSSTTIDISIYDVYTNCMILLHKLLNDSNTNTNKIIRRKVMIVQVISSLSIIMKIVGCHYHYQRAHLLLKSVTIVQSLLQLYGNTNSNSNSIDIDDKLKQCIELCQQHSKNIVNILTKLGESPSSLVIKKVIEIDKWLNKYIM